MLRRLLCKLLPIQQLQVSASRRRHGRHRLHVHRREIHRRLELNAKPVRAKRVPREAAACDARGALFAPLPHDLRWDAPRWNEKLPACFGSHRRRGLAAAAIGHTPGPPW